MTPAETGSLARRLLEAVRRQGPGRIPGMFADDVLLRDWNLEVRGRAAFLAETQHNSENPGWEGAGNGPACVRGRLSR